MNTRAGSGDTQPNRDERRARASRWDMDSEFRHATKELQSAKRLAARDYYTTLKAADVVPLPVTPSKLEAGLAYLTERGLVSARQRYLAWNVAMRALPKAYQSKIQADQIPAARRGSKRSISPEPDEFPRLRADLADLASKATMPPQDDTDGLKQYSHKTLGRSERDLLIVAKRCADADMITKEVSLDEMLSIPTVDDYIGLAFNLNGEGNWVDDEDESGSLRPESRYPLYAGLFAITQLATIKFGATSEQACHARVQAGEHRHRKLSDGAIKLITRMLQPSNLAVIKKLEVEWIDRAESETNLHSRHHWADLAAGIAILRVTLLRPGDLTTLMLDEGGIPILPKRRKETTGDVTLPSDTLEIVARRNRIRRMQLGEKTPLFPNGSEPQLPRSVSTAFSTATREAGFPGLTLQRLRDVGAVLLLRHDEGRVRRLAALLEYSELRTARRRYAAFLQPTGQGK